MTWEMKDKDDYRIFCHLGNRKYLFADECLFQGKGYSAAVYLVDLDTFNTDVFVNGDSFMKLIEEEDNDIEKASLIADEMEECDFRTECFSDEESMWRYVEEYVIEVMGV